MNILLILISSLLSCGGQLCQKQATLIAIRGQRAPMLAWLGLSVLLLLLAMAVWLRVLQVVPVGVAYPMLSLNFIFVTLTARWIWHERVSVRHAIGVVLVVAGVVVMGSYT